MKALVYKGPGRIAWEDKARPMLQEPTNEAGRTLDREGGGAAAAVFGNAAREQAMKVILEAA